MATKTSVPKKFRDKEFTFVETLTNGKGEDSTFKLFPKNVKFVRKDEDEDVILVVRRHWIAYVTHILLAFVIPLIPLILLFVISGSESALGKTTLYLGLFVASIIIALNIVVTALMQWYYNVAIITDKRVVALDVVNVFQHKYTEILWRKIQDVSHDSVGPLSSVFDIGNIYIDTAGEGIDLTLKFIPRPRDVQDVVDNLVDLAHRGRI
jgi:hypothetical protein